MAPKEMRVKQEDKSAAVDYLRKAQDNYAQMLTALKDNNYNAVGTLAIQCAISSADAISVYEKGIRAISQDHFDAFKIKGLGPSSTTEILSFAFPKDFCLWNDRAKNTFKYLGFGSI